MIAFFIARKRVGAPSADFGRTYREQKEESLPSGSRIMNLWRQDENGVIKKDEGTMGRSRCKDSGVLLPEGELRKYL